MLKAAQTMDACETEQSLPIAETFPFPALIMLQVKATITGAQMGRAICPMKRPKTHTMLSFSFNSRVNFLNAIPSGSSAIP